MNVCFALQLTTLTKNSLFMLRILVIFSLIFQYSSSDAQSNKILLPGIVSELERKQISIDFADTSKDITQIVGKAFSAHGGFRIARPNESQYTLRFTNSSDNQVEVAILSGKPRKIIKILISSGNSSNEAILHTCDKIVSYFLKIWFFCRKTLLHFESLSDIRRFMCQML